jgi:hypothetical protein
MVLAPKVGPYIKANPNFFTGKLDRDFIGKINRDKTDMRAVPEGVTVAEANGRRFISRDVEICIYLASAYGFGKPHV